MEIRYSKKFNKDLKKILDFISKDSKIKAVQFAKGLNDRILKTAFMPYSFRKNSALSDECVRDLIYKGYVIPFSINDKFIDILGIYKHNLWKP